MRAKQIYSQMQSWQIAEWSSEGHYSTSCVSIRRRIFRIVGCFNQNVFKSLEKARLSDLPVSVCGSKLFKTVDQADLIFTEQWRPLDWNRGSHDAWYAPGFGTGVHLCKCNKQSQDLLCLTFVRARYMIQVSKLVIPKPMAFQDWPAQSSYKHHLAPKDPQRLQQNAP